MGTTDKNNAKIVDGQLIDKITTYDEYLAADENARKRHVYVANEEDDISDEDEE